MPQALLFCWRSTSERSCDGPAQVTLGTRHVPSERGESRMTDLKKRIFLAVAAAAGAATTVYAFAAPFHAG